MSVSLIRRGLELLNDDIKDGSGVKNKKKQKTPSSAAAMDLVSTKRQGITRQIKRLQGRLGPGKSKATVKDKWIRSAVEDFRKNQPKSQMSANLKYFLDTTCKATASDTMKILNHNKGRQSRDRPDKPVKQTKEPESVFTEEEFQQFQKEYFGRTVEDKK
ncbi:ribosomal protein S19 binding protein 1 [Cyprinodon tularosa]|uniref:Active regulator of SIRT1 n=1 Tax=Cyprinodon variegatus TaxID=28743 RepID=A0A3Q2E1C7_CYPVA|nr:PREDICTED: active regulator of SIRT1 [Cyprinodon variegatus]XP_038160736.1 ribosomal protein S19 binding protein 1 [Cyprinodon tularosa]